MNKTQITAYIKARYPSAKRNNKSGGWDTASYPHFVSDKDAAIEAEAEKDLYEAGYAKKPNWLEK